ncbi:hypothetical protein B0H14DRAFT_2787413 [Mycena olivaceomarginata]|nr:hypothetical protein B0H14DRAFT_2787413 [Mycena olivaceomarginata]
MHFSFFTKIVLLSTSLALQARAGPLAAETTRAVPWAPSEDNLLYNTTAVPQGELAVFGWGYSGTFGDPPLVTGLAENVTMLVTPPGSVERFAFRYVTGPTSDLCGFFPGHWAFSVVDSSVLGTYMGRWIVDYGGSTQPDVPVDPDSGCGPAPFSLTTVEFVKMWEVVEAA